MSVTIVTYKMSINSGCRCYTCTISNVLRPPPFPVVHLWGVCSRRQATRDGERSLGPVEHVVPLLQDVWVWGPVRREGMQQPQVSTGPAMRLNDAL